MNFRECRLVVLSGSKSINDSEEFQIDFKSIIYD